MEKKTMRLYQIICAAQRGTPMEDVRPPLTPAERADCLRMLGNIEESHRNGWEPEFFSPHDDWDFDDDDDDDDDCPVMACGDISPARSWDL